MPSEAMPPADPGVQRMALALLASGPASLLCRAVVSRCEGRAPPRPVALGAVAFVFGWAALVVADPWTLAASLGLVWTLLALALIDLDSLRLPDVLTLPLLFAGLTLSAVLLPDRPIFAHVIGAALGWAFLALMAAAWRRWRGREGIGLGDAKLLGAAGAWLGWAALPSVILAACILAFGWVAVRLILRGRASLRVPLAFGAPLCLAMWLVWLYGPMSP